MDGTGFEISGVDIADLKPSANDSQSFSEDSTG